jgi:hypothetical protein
MNILELKRPLQLLPSFPLALIALLFFFPGYAQPRKIYLHPKSVAIEKQSKFVDSIRFIPLEMKEGFELSSNYNINIAGKYILLVDYMNKTLLMYSKEGKFVKSINYKKLGESFYPSYNQLKDQIVFFGNNKNYSLTSKDLVKIRMDWNDPRNKKYFRKYTIDLKDPSLTIKKETPDEKDIVQIHHLYGDYYLQGQITVSPLFENSLDHELKIYRNNTLVKTYFPYNRANEPRFMFSQEYVSLNRTSTDSINFITRPYCDTIYKMIGDSVSPAYQLVLPLENTLPSSFYSRPFKNKTERENFQRNNGWAMRQVHSFYETPKFISFMVGYLANYDAYIYDKEKDITYKAKNIKSDTSQYNLQLFSNFGLMREGDKLYRAQKAADILPFFEQNKNVPIPGELQEFIKSKPLPATPVVVEFKLKN